MFGAILWSVREGLCVQTPALSQTLFEIILCLPLFQIGHLTVPGDSLIVSSTSDCDFCCIFTYEKILSLYKFIDEFIIYYVMKYRKI